MKKTETKISSVRQINDPSLSIVKIKRHQASSRPKPNTNKVNFDLRKSINKANVFSLPVAIPEEGLKELNSSPHINTKPVYFKPSKKNTQPIKSTKKGIDGGESNTDGTSEYINKLTSDIQAIEDKLSKVESVLSKKIDNVSSSHKTQANSVSFKTDVSKDQKVYNASDYVDDINMVEGYPSFYDRNSYSMELHNRIIKPLRNPETLSQQYPIEFDPKVAVSAIRSELEQWRKENRQTYRTVSSASILRNEASSCDLVTSLSEENTVSRDIAEKDLPSSSEDSRNKFQEKVKLETQIIEQKATDYPLDHYLDSEKIKKKIKPMEQKKTEQDEGPQYFNRTEKFIRQINNLATEAEEKVKACIFNRTIGPSPILSPISLDESDSGYTEYLVESKFNEVTFQKPQETEWKLQATRKEQQKQSRKPYSNRSNNNLNKYEREASRTVDGTGTFSLMPSKQSYKKVFNEKLDSKRNQPHNSKSSSLINSKNKNFREELSEANYPKNTCHYCSCNERTDIGYHLKHLKDPSQKDWCHQTGKNLTDFYKEEANVTYREKQYNDASVNTDPFLVRPNTNLVNVVSLKEEKSIKMNDCGKKLCQIQELPLVVIRPNFTKQVGPIIDIKTTLPSSPTKNVAIVECIHKGSFIGTKPNPSVNIKNESVIDSASQTVSPPAVHFKHSRDLKLLKVTKDLLGKLHFKDGVNVEKLKRSLGSLVKLLQQISPIHVANLRLSNLDASSASESIDTFFSNIDLVTEIIENEIKKPTGRYCDYPECLIKAVDLLCGNIRSVFIIEDVLKRNSRTIAANGSGEEKKKVKKFSISRGRKAKESRKTFQVSDKFSSVTSSIDTYETEENLAANSNRNMPGNLYIPYRLLIPGGKHKAMEEAKNSREIELRFKRLEKVLEINENLKKTVPSKEELQTDNLVPSSVEKDKALPNKNSHDLNETFVIKSASDDDEESEMIQDNFETKINKAEEDYEDDWEVDSSKSYDGSMAMTEINILAQVHSVEEQNSVVHSSPKKKIMQNQFPRQLSVSSKGSQTSPLGSQDRTNQGNLIGKETKGRKKNLEQIPSKQVLGELKDVEAQYYNGKEDIATMYCEEVNQKPKVEIIEPISIAPESGSFTVLRMTNASTNSLLEVRFPEQTDKLQSSLTVQKTQNREEVKLLYNLDKEDNKINQLNDHEDGLKSSSYNEPRKTDSFKLNAPNIIEKVVSNCERNIDDKPLEKKEEINDFQNITTNFIQFLESKVTEMVNKFKTSEITCEKLLDQKLMGPAEDKVSVNHLQIASSKTSLKNHFFYKSASSLISSQSNEDYGNWLSHRCTPDNQEITPFENLTSPPVGLQLKNSSVLTGASLKQCMGPNPELQNVRDSNLFQSPLNLDAGNQNSENPILGKIDDGILNKKVTGNDGSVLEEQKIDVPIVNELHNRLLPLPEDVSYNKCSKVVVENGKAENMAQENDTLQQTPQISSFKNNGTTIHEEDISKKKSALFEEAILALTNVEQIFENNKTNEESTVIVGKTPSTSSKGEEELDSQGTSLSHIPNIFSTSESGIVPKCSFQSKTLMPITNDPNTNVTADSKLGYLENKPMNSSEVISVEKDFSRLFPIPEQVIKDPSDIELYDSELQVVSNANVHTVFISGPSHVDTSLKSSDTLFRKIDNSSVLENKSLNNTFDIQSPASINECVENLAFNDPPFSSNLITSDVTVVPLKNSPQISISSQNYVTIDTKQYNKTLATSQETIILAEESIQTLPLNADDISETSDDCIKLNYFNPEEMSDGEIGYACTSNSYSSGEIKPYNQYNDFTSGNKAVAESSLTKVGKTDINVMHVLQIKTMDSSSSKGDKKEGNDNVENLLNSSNDSTSTGELKNLFNKEEKIDEGKLIDIHGHCSAWFSSESSGGSEPGGIMENR